MSSPPVEGTGVCALPIHSQAEHLWKLEGSSVAAGPAFPMVQDVPAHPASSEVSHPWRLGSCSCNRNNVPHRLGGFQPSLNHITLMQPDKYIPLYPAPLTLRLISKPDSAQPSSWAHSATCQHHLSGTAARLGTWQRCRTQLSSILIPPCAPGAALQETL